MQTISRDTTWADTSVPYTFDNISVLKAKLTWARGISVRFNESAYLTISGNGTLTIAPGVKIQFGKRCFIEVGYGGQGTLIAQGTAWAAGN